MNVWNDFESYVKDELQGFDFESIYNGIKSSNEYCSHTLRNILILTIFAESAKKESEYMPILSSYNSMLNVEDERKNILLPQLLFIVALCSKIRDKVKSQSNLYL